MKSYIYIFLSSYVALSLLLPACGNKAQSDDHGHEHPEGFVHEEDKAQADSHAHEEEEGGEEVALNLLQMKKIGLELGSFEQKNLKAVIKVNGVLEIPPQNKASVSSLLNGIVKKIHVRPGQYIRKGGLLASIQHTELIDWQEQLLVAEGELVFLRKEYERQKSLVEKEIAAQKQFEKVSSELKIAEAHRMALRSKLSMLGINPDKIGDKMISTIGLRSPMGGFVKNIGVNTGAFVPSNQELFDIVDNHHIHIDLKVFEKDLPFISIGQKIDFSLQSKPGEVMQANIFSIGKAMNEQDRTVMVHAEIDNKTAQLLPGMYVEARIITENQTVTSLPEAAITSDKGLKYIFIKEETMGDETHFKKVQVITGGKDIGYVEIDPMIRLTGKEEVVVKGAYFLMAQTKKGEPGGGHHH